MKIVALSHDPGGANAVAATVAALRASGAAVDAYVKGPAQRQFAQLGVAAEELADGGAALRASPDAAVLLTGTSADDDFELDAIAEAARAGVPSVALIDYPANYRRRFVRRRAGAAVKLCLPDVVAALDAASAGALAADGIPAACIVVVGQPYFAWLMRSGRRLRAVDGLDTAGGAARLLFASEPGPAATAALAALAPVAARSADRVKLAIRFHPRETDRGAALELLAAAGVPFEVEETPDTLACLARYRAVVGLTSTILMEAALLGLPAASILVGGADDLLRGWRAGLVSALRGADDVARFVAAPREPALARRFRDAHREADLRAAALCRRLARGAQRRSA